MTAASEERIPAVDRNRTTVRRAVRAGAVVGMIVGLGLVPVVMTENGPGLAVLVMSGLAAAAVVAAGWLLLAAGLDLVAGEKLGRRRIMWTVAATLAAMLMPFLVLGSLTQAATRGATG